MTSIPNKKRVAVLASGSGSNLQALINVAKQPDYPAAITLVISDKPAARALTRARQENISVEVVTEKSKAARDAAILTLLESNNIELVCLAGYMRLVSPLFVDTWRDKLINIHPSLLPSFKGLDTHQRVLELGTKITGCTVHFVRDGMDEGPIICQAAVPVLPDDTAEMLAARVLEQEHIIYPAALAWLASKKISVEHEQVVYHSSTAEDHVPFQQMLAGPPTGWWG